MSNFSFPNKLSLGRFGEEVVKKILLRKGWQILGQNYYTHHTELDLIAQDQDEIVFVEVKTRMSTFGSGEEAMNFYKQRNLIRAAQIYLLKKHWEDRPWRIDVFIVDMENGKIKELRYYKNAVEG